MKKILVLIIIVLLGFIGVYGGDVWLKGERSVSMGLVGKEFMTSIMFTIEGIPLEGSIRWENNEEATVQLFLPFSLFRKKKIDFILSPGIEPAKIKHGYWNFSLRGEIAFNIHEGYWVKIGVQMPFSSVKGEQIPRLVFGISYRNLSFL